MATSGTTTFTVTRDQIIESALRSLAVLEEGAQPSPTALENSAFSLNLILKKWQSEGIKLWTVVEYTIPMVAGQTSYTIGPSIEYDFNADKPLRIIQSFLRNNSTNLSGLEGGYGYTPASGTFTYTNVPSYVISGSEMITTPNLNVTVTNGTVVSVTNATDGVGPQGLSSTLGVLNTYLGGTGSDFNIAVTTSNIDLPMTLISEQEYNILGSKFSTGNVNSVYYKPWVNYGEIKVFLTPSANTAANYELHITVQRPIQDITKPNQNFDFPSEWFLALKWALVAELASDYEKPLNDKTYYEQKADMLKGQLMDWDIEWTSTYFQPDVRQGFNRSFR